MSVRLRELIRAVRSCKTQAEERDVIAKESAALREAFREQDPRYRHRNIAKLMYIHMLGYPTHFGQMETLKLIAANGFPEKRIGYLGLMLLLDERQEVLMLVTNSLKMDLNNDKNPYIVGLALAALGNICSAEMARDLAPDVERLLERQPNPYIRKKAALCAIRVLKKNPELVEEFADKAADLLHDKNQGVALSGVTLLLAICNMQPAMVEHYRQQVPTLCKMLRALLQGGFSPEHDVGGITNPFLQVKILQLLRVLGRGNADASDAMTDILAQVAANVEGSRNAGNAILYEAVATIMGIETIGGLRVMAVNILGRFLANRDNNIRYVALNTLAKVVAVDTQAVQRHRATIVDCVKDADVSIRRRALELVYSLVNQANIRNLTRELLDYLAVCDGEFKPDLTAKIATLIQRYAPDKRWHIDSMLQVLVQAGAHVKEEAVRALIVLISNAEDLHGYAVRALYGAVKQHLNTAAPSLLVAGGWCIGEFGEMLPTGRGGALLDGESPQAVGEADVVGLLEALLRLPKLAAAAREVALTAAMKLTARLPSQGARLAALVERHKGSVLLEVQARSCEYSRLLAGHAGITPQLLERMPALDEAEYSRNLASGAVLSPPTSSGGAAPGAAAAAGGAAAAAAAPASDDLVDLLGGLEVAAATVGRVSGSGAAIPAAAAAANPLDDMLGLGAAPSAAAAAGGGGLDDLLGPGLAPAAAAPAAASDILGMLGDPGTAAAAAPVDPLANLLGAGAPAAARPAAAAAATVPVFNQEGLSISFAVTPLPGQPGAVDIIASYSNAGLDDVADFNLQAAVPKYMQLRLEPASSTLLPALGGSASQQLHVVNSMAGQKPLAMRLRVNYTKGGQPVTQQLEVNNFPAGL
uniref:AP-1 complex subunit gamma n=1 Tax=Tetradesmus obliquus TaxID=3088 RepID=A0A383VEJ1_TETOB|eukprot:jgi/Sobl393_1/17530/SZX63978.1